MDTKTLITEAKARFNHNAAKEYLKDKYDSKLVVAEQGGLWKASPELISFLAAMDDDSIVVIDTFDNPVQVKRTELLHILKKTYSNAMAEWYIEWSELETKR